MLHCCKPVGTGGSLICYFIAFGYVVMREKVSHGRCSFSFIEEHAAFQNGGSRFDSNHNIRAPFTLRFHQHLCFFPYMIAIGAVGRWRIILFLFAFSCLASDPEHFLFVGHFNFIFWKLPVHVLFPLLTGFFILLLLNVIALYRTLYQLCILQIFHPIL